MKITIIPGDGIGPEIMDATLKILNAYSLDLFFESYHAGQTSIDLGKDLIPNELIESIKRNKMVLKGPITTPLGNGFSSVNVALRKQLDLYVNFRPIQSLDKTIDLVLFRENSEGLYLGEEHWLSQDEVYAVKKVSRKGSERIIKAAFEYALKKDRKKVTLVHKANILKQSDGLFLEIGKQISKEYPHIQFEQVIVDNMCMQLVINPGQFDVIVTTNLYGDILSDLCAGLVGGLGVVPGANLGKDLAIFEAVHGSAPDIAGKNMANPISLLRTACLMLDSIGYHHISMHLTEIIDASIKMNKTTKDLGGDLSTSEYVDYLLGQIRGSYENISMHA